MQPGQYEEIPLTADERDMLFTIYNTRRKFLLVVYFLLIMAAIGANFMGIYSGIIHFSNKIHNDRAWIAGVAILEIMLIISGLYFLFSRVLPFRRDIRSGIKEKIPYTVIKKQHFPLTNQYYLTLDDPKYLYHETHAGMYNSVYEGGNVYLYRAKYSRYVFEENGRFTVI